MARVFSLACAAAQLPLLTTTLQPSEYSAIAIAIAISTYFSLFSAEPVILGFERFPGANSDRSSYRYALARTAALLGLAALLVLGVAYFLGYLAMAVAFVGWAIGISVNRLVSFAWLMWGHSWQYTWNLMAGTGARTVTVVGLVLAGWNPLLSLGIAGIASAVAALILSPRLGLTAGGNRTWRPWAFGFGVKLALAALAYIVLTNGNLLVLALLVPSERVGSYAVMMQVSTLTSGALLGLVLAVAYPPLRLAWDEGHRASVHASLTMLQTGCLVVASGVVFTCYAGDSFLLRLVLPDQYINQAVLAPLVMSTALAAMGGIASLHHQLKLEAGRVARRTIIASFIGLGVTVALSGLFQEPGAAIGASSGFLIYLIIMQAGTRLPAITVTLGVVSAVLTSISIGVRAIPADVIAYIALVIALVVSSMMAHEHRSVRRRAKISK